MTVDNCPNSYEIVVRALGAENVPAAAGTTVAFAWAMNDSLQTTQQEEIESDGFVEWDAICRMQCCLLDSHGVRRQKFCSFKLMAVPQGEPLSSGLTVCETAIDVTELCMAGDKPTHYTIDMHPAGRLHLNICAIPEPEITNHTGEAAGSPRVTKTKSGMDGFDKLLEGSETLDEGNASSLSELDAAFDPQSAAYNPTLAADIFQEGISNGNFSTTDNIVASKDSEREGESSLEEGMAKLQVTAIADTNSTPNGANSGVAKRKLTLDIGEESRNNGTTAPGEEAGSRHTDGSFQSWLDHPTSTEKSGNGGSTVMASADSSSASGRLPGGQHPSGGSKGMRPSPSLSSRMYEGSFCTPGSVISSDASGDSLDTTDPIAALRTMRKKCQRLIQAREEARAESFAQASMAVQRGIEIDNLKRAKDMLLQRLEVAESELLASYQRGTDGDSALNSPKSTQGGGDPDMELLQALVAAKVELAQKDYAIMELQGALRHAEERASSFETQLNMALEANAALSQASHPWWLGTPKTPAILKPRHRQGSADSAAAAAPASGSAARTVDSTFDAVDDIEQPGQGESIKAGSEPSASEPAADGSVVPAAAAGGSGEIAPGKQTRVGPLIRIFAHAGGEPVKPAS